MSVHDDVIQVICCAFPSGETIWLNAEKDMENIREIIDAWARKHPEYDGSGSSMGIVEISMPFDKFVEVSNREEYMMPQS